MLTKTSSWAHDVGEEIAKRNAFMKQAEADCKNSFPVAWKFRGAGPAGKPYRNCVSAKMSAYDSAVEQDKADKQAAVEFQKMTETEVLTQQGKLAEAQRISAQTQNISAQAELKAIENAWTPGHYFALVAVFCLLAAGYLYFSKSKPKSTATTTATSVSVPVKR